MSERRPMKVRDDAQNVYPSDLADVRLGRVLAGLAAGAKLIRDAVRQQGPDSPLKQALDLEEHPGHWLTRPQIMAATDAASTIESILRELEVRIDPRCKGTVKGSMDRYGEYCRCTLPRHEGDDHKCEHSDG